MCSPSALGSTSIALQAGGGVYSAISQKNAGDANASYYNLLAERNGAMADIIEKQGQIQESAIVDDGARTARDLKREQARFEGSQRASFASNGIAGSVTAENILSDTLDSEKLDELTLKYNTDLRARAVRNQAEQQAGDQRFQKVANESSAKMAKLEGIANMTNTLLSSATSIASSSYDMAKAGYFKLKDEDALQPMVPPATNLGDIPDPFAKYKTDIFELKGMDLNSMVNNIPSAPKVTGSIPSKPLPAKVAAPKTTAPKAKAYEFSPTVNQPPYFGTANNNFKSKKKGR